MSRYEWERGTITLPSAEWVKFRNALIQGFAVAQRQDFQTLERLHAAVVATTKGKRGVNFQEAVQKAFQELEGRFKLKVADEYRAMQAVLKKDEATGKHKLHAPKKKDFPDPKQTAKSIQFSADGGTITLDNTKRTVSWGVSENNHACETARETFMGRLLFQQLGRVKWTRGSGGAIIGNDEYNREAGEEHAGGGGSYLKDRFGPEGDKEYERTHGFKPPAPRTASRVSRRLPLLPLGRARY